MLWIYTAAAARETTPATSAMAGFRATLLAGALLAGLAVLVIGRVAPTVSSE